MRYTRWALGAIACVVMAILAGLACSSNSGSPAPANYGLDDLNAGLSGSPTPADQAAANALAQGLNATELQHLITVDWSTMTGQGVLNDPVTLKALSLVAAVDPNTVTLTPQSKAGLSTEGLTTQDCPGDPTCANCTQALQTALTNEIAAIQLKLGAIALTCAGLTAATGGTGGLACGIVLLYMYRQEQQHLAELQNCVVLISQSFSGTPSAISTLNTMCSQGDLDAGDAGDAASGCIVPYSATAVYPIDAEAACENACGWTCVCGATSGQHFSADYKVLPYGPTPEGGILCSGALGATSTCNYLSTANGPALVICQSYQGGGAASVNDAGTIVCSNASYDGGSFSPITTLLEQTSFFMNCHP